ncbi:hypothetical protein ACFL4H_00335 [Candidatus Neomarinimicrobiota bacterium]
MSNGHGDRFHDSKPYVYDSSQKKAPTHTQAMQWSIADFASYYGRDVEGFDIDKFMWRYGDRFHGYDPTESLAAKQGFLESRGKLTEGLGSNLRAGEGKAAGKGLLLSGVGKQAIRSLRDTYSKSMQSALTQQDLGVFGAEEKFINSINALFGELREGGAFDEATYDLTIDERTEFNQWRNDNATGYNMVDVPEDVDRDERGHRDERGG